MKHPDAWGKHGCWGQCHVKVPYLAAFTCDDSVVDPGGLITTNFAWYHFNLCWKGKTGILSSESFLLTFTLLPPSPPLPARALVFKNTGVGLRVWCEVIHSHLNGLLKLLLIERESILLSCLLFPKKNPKTKQKTGTRSFVNFCCHHFILCNLDLEIMWVKNPWDLRLLFFFILHFKRCQGELSHCLISIVLR